MKRFNQLPFLAMLLVLGFSACEKENRMDCFEENPDANELNTSLETPEGFAASIPAAFEEIAVSGGDENEAFYMENAGIPVFLDEEPFEGDALAGRKHARCRLHGELELSTEQKQKLHTAWEEYLQCRHASLEKIRTAYHELHLRMEQKRADLLHAYRANRMTESEFKAAMDRLRHEFKSQSLKIRRLNYDVIQHCYKNFLIKAQHILRPDQFKAFMHCHKGHLPQR